MIRFLKKLYYVPSATLNTSAEKNLARMNLLLKDFKEPLLINIGSGERFIGKKSLNKNNGKMIVNLDISPYPSVDVVADAHILPFKKNAFHGVICQAVLEHTKSPLMVIKEIERILNKGGILYVEVPFLQGFHPSPSDYYRFTLMGIHQLFANFICVDSGICVGPSSTLSWILRDYLSGLFSGFSENKFTYKAAILIFGWLTFPIKYFDMILAKKKGAHRIASGLYYLGKKK